MINSIKLKSFFSVLKYRRHCIVLRLKTLAIRQSQFGRAILLILFLSFLIIMVIKHQKTTVENDIPSHRKNSREDVRANINDKPKKDFKFNNDYQREILYGKKKLLDSNSAMVENGKGRDPTEDLLTNIFTKVDKNKNKLLTAVELERWILLQVAEHLKEGVHENNAIFKQVDKDGNGKVTWDEYHIFYLISKGVDKGIAEKHLEVHDDLDLREQEQILQDKFRWSEADEDKDSVLSVSEFLSFRHPEHSTTMLYHIVRDILNSLDVNGDDKLSVSEFAALPPGEDELVWVESESKFQAERFKDFNMIIDINKDGFVTFDELLKYTDPKNKQHAKSEAESLVILADTNKDGVLSLSEVLKHREIFLNSKVVNVGDVVHDEF